MKMTTDLKQRYGTTALIAGASEGLGAAFAEALAAAGFNLVLLARRNETLAYTCRQLEGRYPVRVSAVVCDLSEPAAFDQVRAALGQTEIGLLIYNAALPYIGHYLDFPQEQYNRMVNTNVMMPMKFVHHFGGLMVDRGRGGIVLMTSLAGFQGSGFIAGYAATKAFTTVLAEGLWYEWKNKGVDIIGCCAGATATPNYIRSNPAPLGFIQPQVQSPAAVVGECLQNIGRVPSCVSGRKNRIAAWFMRHLLSRQATVNIMGAATRKMYNVTA